jgi:DegV family protein with EDD domain
LVQHPRVAVVVDSSSCLPRDIQESSGITVVPHQLIADGKVYRDGIDIEPREFYQLQQRNGVVTTTSGPGPQAFLEAFQKAASETQEVICITLSPRFSATTYDSAHIAARMAREQQPDLEIRVIDSQAAAGAEGFIALEASRASLKGEGLSEIVPQVEALIPRVQLLAFLDTLHYLGKSGKITKVKAWAGTLLGFKPLTELSQGEARLVAKPRSRAKAMEQILSIAVERMGDSPSHVNVMHANASEDAQELCERAQRALNCHEIFISEFTPVMGAHTGPGLLGLAFYSDP